MSDALLEWIPNDVWIVIFGFLSIKDLGRVATLIVNQVCTLFNRLSEDDSIWRLRYQENFASRQNSQFAEQSRATNENRGWKIRFRFALNNVPLHNILFGSSHVHKLCVHIRQGEAPLNTCCTTDRFWRGVYHHSIPYDEILTDLHNGFSSQVAEITFTPSNLYHYWSTESKHPTRLHIRYFKCLMVGDKDVGKTTLLSSLAFMEYKTDYKNATEFSVTVMVHKRILTYHIDVVSDTERLEELANDYDIILVCFSACNRQSFKNVATWSELCKSKLRQQAKKPSLGAPDPEQVGLWKDLSPKIVLIGTHLDVALDKQVKQELLVSFREADRIAESIQANLYRECSSQKLTGLADLFVSVSGLYTRLEKLEVEVGSKKAAPGMDGLYNANKKDKCVVQ